MRLIYFDIDTQRADHLGCYGYHRNTSPNIDRIAAEGVRFDRCYASDTPCLPSRSALLTGQFGIHNGVVNHGGVAAELFRAGASREFQSTLGHTTFPARLRRAGMKTATISSFPARHSAYHWLAGFAESYDVGKFGWEQAHEVAAIAHDWLRRNGAADDWFLHVHMWDPHAPYRVDLAYGEPFGDDPPPDWLTEEVRQRHWDGCGPHSAQESMGFGPNDAVWGRFPRQPQQVGSMVDVCRVFDGYDTGVRYADDHVGRILNTLADLSVLDDTAVMVSADHGETLGELNIYSDHHTADEHTTHLPMILRWPGLDGAADGRVDDAFHYQIDVAATLLELVGARVPRVWDGESFARAFREGRSEGRDHLVVSQAAWTCQRAVRFGDYICIRTYHDGYHGLPELMLFDIARDPHEQQNLADQRPDLVGQALAMLEAWHADMMRSATQPTDPLWTVLREGGGYHVRGQLRAYLERLRKTGRDAWAQQLEHAHPDEV